MSEMKGENRTDKVQFGLKFHCTHIIESTHIMNMKIFTLQEIADLKKPNNLTQSDRYETRSTNFFHRICVVICLSKRYSVSVEFEFGLPVIFLQPLVPNMKISADFTVTSLSFPVEICINKWWGLLAVRKLPPV